jgi:hypothetical protein
MKRIALLTALAFALCTPLAFAQAPPPPAQKAKFIPPIKGHGTIDVQRLSSKRVGKEMVTKVKVKNTSKGSINLLKIEQHWYDAGGKPVSFGDYAHRKAPILPGEVVEITVLAPDNPKINRDLMLFTHAYGKIDARAVKKIE